MLRGLLPVKLGPRPPRRRNPLDIVLLGCAALPQLIDDERPLLEALRARGATPDIVDWRAPGRDLHGADAVLVRNAWDYYDHPAEFEAFLASSVPPGRTFNPPPLLRWNTHKRYLVELGGLGVPLPPTRLLARGSEPDPTAARLPGCDELVLKPAISGNAQGTTRRRASDGAGIEADLGALLPHGDVLVQAFLPAIEDRGELSLVYLAGEYSHALCKRPAAGDFRVQDRHGGRVDPVPAPSPAVRAFADHALAQLPPGLGEALYARVDLVDDPEHGPLLMELELVEPELFFRTHPPAADRLAARLLERARR